jgi:hypothetical protein
VATGSIRLIQPVLLQDRVKLLGLQQARRRETPLAAETVFTLGSARTLHVDAMNLCVTALGKLN